VTQHYGRPGLTGSIGQSGLPPALAAAAAPPSTLLNGLTAWYKLDETSGVRLDSTANSYDLSDNNTVGSTTGLIGNAARFDRTASEYLLANINPSTFWAQQTDYTVSFWLYVDSAVHVNGQYFMEGRLVNSASFYVRWVSSGSTIEGAFYATNGGVRATAENVAGDLVDNAWNHIVLWYDSSDSKGRMQVNLGTPNVTSALPADSRAMDKLAIGSSAVPSVYQNCDIDLYGIWGARILTSDEITELNNSGSGKDYDFS